MKITILVLVAGLLLTGVNTFADDVTIDSNGNITTGSSGSGNLEVTGASGEDAIVGSASGTGASGVYGINTDNNAYGILGYTDGVAGYGVYGSSTGYAGYFQGDVRITGSLILDGYFAGYSETDPVFSGWDRSTGISVTESQISDLSHFTNTDETDPTVPSSLKDGVSWSELSGIPTGFADGTDNDTDTTYSDGTGLNLVGTTFSLNIPLILNQSVSAGVIQTTNTGTSNFARLSSTWEGVFGYSVDNRGVVGQSDNSDGVLGKNLLTGNYGKLGSPSSGVYGSSDETTGIGVFAEVAGSSGHAVQGESSGSGGMGVLGKATGQYGWGIYGTSDGSSGRAVVGKDFGGGIGGYFSSTSGLALKADGTAQVNILEIIGGSDLSENFDIRTSESELLPAPGMVVSIDPENPGDLVVSSNAYDRRVAGIISGAGGVNTGMLMKHANTKADGDTPVALTGRVYCRADASRGPIEPGDLLTTSKIPGHAMKVSDYSKAQGAILGKAMTSLDKGRGLVLVLVTLQ